MGAVPAGRMRASDVAVVQTNWYDPAG